MQVTQMVFKAFVLASLTVAGVASFALRPKKSKHSSDKVSEVKRIEAILATRRRIEEVVSTSSSCCASQVARPR
jgi:outer membrane murein-binding lipoprotein Lpp